MRGRAEGTGISSLSGDCPMPLTSDLCPPWAGTDFRTLRAAEAHQSRGSTLAKPVSLRGAGPMRWVGPAPMASPTLPNMGACVDVYSIYIFLRDLPLALQTQPAQRPWDLPACSAAPGGPASGSSLATWAPAGTEALSFCPFFQLWFGFVF